MRRPSVDEPVVRASFLSVFGDYCRVVELRPGQLFRRAGLSYTMVHEPGAPVPLMALSELFDVAAADCDDPALGLHFAEWIEPGHVGLFDQLVLSADTFRQGLDLASRYIETTITQMQLQFAGRGGVMRLSGRMPSSLSTPAYHFADFLLATVVLRGRAALGADWHPAAVALPRPTPSDVSEHERLFGPRIEFGTAEFQISMWREEIDAPMPTGWPGLGRTVQQVADVLLDDVQSRLDFVGQVRRLISDRLSVDENVGLQAVAQALNLSTRALQWRLGRHHTTYDTVLKEVRVQLADTFLRDTTRPLADIGRSLGFSEASAFTRWSRAQFDMPPSAYRRVLLQQK